MPVERQTLCRREPFSCHCGLYPLANLSRRTLQVEGYQPPLALHKHLNARGSQLAKREFHANGSFYCPPITVKPLPLFHHLG